MDDFLEFIVGLVGMILVLMIIAIFPPTIIWLFGVIFDLAGQVICWLDINVYNVFDGCKK